MGYCLYLEGEEKLVEVGRVQQIGGGYISQYERVKVGNYNFGDFDDCKEAKNYLKKIGKAYYFDFDCDVTLNKRQFKTFVTKYYKNYNQDIPKEVLDLIEENREEYHIFWD